MKYRLTEDCEALIDGIIYYIALDNENAAMRVYEHIIETCEMVVHMPKMGRNPGYVSNPETLCVNVKRHSHYQLYYQRHKKEVVILWVIDGVRDLPNLFADLEQ